MAYVSVNPDFWVATAAAAPLIATATAVAMTPAFEAWKRTRDGRPVASVHARWLYLSALLLGEGNFTLQAFVLFQSLRVLAGEKGNMVGFGISGIAKAEGIGLLLILLLTGLTGFASAFPDRLHRRGLDYPGDPGDPAADDGQIAAQD
jgi:hypothetical protein